MTSDGPVPAGVAEANNIFKGNAATIIGFPTLNPVPTSTMTKTGTTLTVHRHVHRPGAGHLHEGRRHGWRGRRLANHDDCRHLEIQQLAAALPGFLSDAGRFGFDGPAVDKSSGAEAMRMQAINPDNFVQYPTGCTLACHFAPLRSACVDPPVTAPTAPPANPPSPPPLIPSNTIPTMPAWAMRIHASVRAALTNLINMLPTATNPPTPKQVPGLPVSMLSGLPGSLNTDPKWGLAAVTSCPTAGTDACIQLRLDAVGYALNATQAANGLSGWLETTAEGNGYQSIPDRHVPVHHRTSIQELFSADHSINGSRRHPAPSITPPPTSPRCLIPM